MVILIPRKLCVFGIGGAMQAGASVIDTAATDATNIEMQNKQMGFNANQAAITRTFDAQQAALQRNFASAQQIQAEEYNTEMSNTAETRRSQDLKSAGLNPLLAVGNPATAPVMSAPSGASASGPSASSSTLPNINGIMSGIQGVLTQDAQRRNLDAQSKVAEANANLANSKLPYAAGTAAQELDNLKAQHEQILNAADKLDAEWHLTWENVDKVSQDVDFQRQAFPLEQRLRALTNQAKAYGLPELAMQAEYYKSPAAAHIFESQQAEKIGSFGGWLDTAAQGLRRAFSDKNLSSAAGQAGPDIQAPQF